MYSAGFGENHIMHTYVRLSSAACRSGNANGIDSSSQAPACSTEIKLVFSVYDYMKKKKNRGKN